MSIVFFVAYWKYVLIHRHCSWNTTAVFAIDILYKRCADNGNFFQKDVNKLLTKQLACGNLLYGISRG